MRYDNEELQELLAAEFVLGNLRGAARNRFIALMRQHAGLRGRVEAWEERLFPLALRGPSVKAPPHVWRMVRARIAPQRGTWLGPARWRWRIALAGVALALAALVYVGVSPPDPRPFTTIAVLNDQQAQPGILVSWTPKQVAQRRISVRILAHPDMPPGTSWQAWIVTSSNPAPIALGLVTAAEVQVLELSAAAAEALRGTVTIGVSVEPKGGSVTGRPGGPFLFQGPALKVEG